MSRERSRRAVYRFALLEHDHPQRHWDLLLEYGPACRTWRLEAALTDDVDIPAEASADHRVMYLDYSGPVSGNRGHVVRVDRGNCVWLTATDDLVVVVISGGVWSGRLEIRRRDDNGWQANLSRPETHSTG